MAINPTDARDQAFMRTALGLARRGLGRVAPNPAVGCVIVKDGLVVGRGWTQTGGRPHAETEALRRAGTLAQGATAYVTLEPCAHWGQTPPCADALIAAGVARVVVALQDPDPRVSGEGLRRMAAAGVGITTGVCEAEAAEVNAGFLRRVTVGRPLVTLKLASTIDSRIATHSGESRWITGENARAAVHRLRAEHDAILVGSGTALADNPELTCRLPGMEDRQPLRIVVDGRLRLPLTSRLVATAREVATLVVTLPGVDAVRRRTLEKCGVEVMEAASDADRHCDLDGLLESLAARGLTRLFVEGGGRMAASLLRRDLVDRLVWFRAASVIGGDGVPAVAAFGLGHLADAPRFERRDILPIGADVLETYIRLG